MAALNIPERERDTSSPDRTARFLPERANARVGREMPSAVTNLCRLFGSVRSAPAKGIAYYWHPWGSRAGFGPRDVPTARQPSMGAPADASLPPRTDKGTPRMSRRPSELLPGRNPQKGGPTPPPSPTRWLPWVFIGLLVAAVFLFTRAAQAAGSRRPTSRTRSSQGRRRRQGQEHRASTVERHDRRQVPKRSDGKKRVHELAGRRTTSRPEHRAARRRSIDFKYVDDGSNILGRHPAVGAAPRC